MDERINDDSREKLEADIERAYYGLHTGREFIEKTIDWLDRQAAITASANAELIERQAKTIVMLQELVDEYEPKQRTVEDVLATFRFDAKNIYDDPTLNGNERVDELVALDERVAAEIREIMGVDG